MVNAAERPNTIEEVGPVLYPNMYTTIVILLLMSAWTLTAERLFSSLVHLSGFAFKHVHKDRTLDAERTTYQFRRVALTFRPNEGQGSYF